MFSRLMNDSTLFYRLEKLRPLALRERQKVSDVTKPRRDFGQSGIPDKG
jgi:hypothetical protein